MESIYNYITDPWTLISFIIFVFWLGVTWAKLNADLKAIEKRVDKIEDLDLDSRLTEIQTNLRRVIEKLKEK